MSRTITIAPVRKTIRVKASRVHAFDVFTSGLGRWWSTTRSIELAGTAERALQHDRHSAPGGAAQRGLSNSGLLGRGHPARSSPSSP
jgi:hypothetical protein